MFILIKQMTSVLNRKVGGLSGLQQSVLGKSEPHGGRLVPTTGFETPGDQNNPGRLVMLGLQKYKIAPNTLSTVIKMKSVNGVLPCNGITRIVLRNPAPSAAQGMQVSQGIARGQRRGLAYGMDWERHNISKAAPILARASSIYRGKNSSLPLTASKY